MDRSIPVFVSWAAVADYRPLGGLKHIYSLAVLEESLDCVGSVFGRGSGGPSAPCLLLGLWGGWRSLAGGCGTPASASVITWLSRHAVFSPGSSRDLRH